MSNTGESNDPGDKADDSFEHVSTPDHAPSGSDCEEDEYLAIEAAREESDNNGTDDDKVVIIGCPSEALQSAKKTDAQKHFPQPLRNTTDAWKWNQRVRDFIQRGADGSIIRYTEYQRPGESLNLPDPEDSDLGSSSSDDSSQGGSVGSQLDNGQVGDARRLSPAKKRVRKRKNRKRTRNTKVPSELEASRDSSDDPLPVDSGVETDSETEVKYKEVLGTKPPPTTSVRGRGRVGLVKADPENLAVERQVSTTTSPPPSPASSVERLQSRPRPPGNRSVPAERAIGRSPQRRVLPDASRPSITHSGVASPKPGASAASSSPIAKPDNPTNKPPSKQPLYRPPVAEEEFRVVDFPRRFFQIGRVFTTVWFEPGSRDLQHPRGQGPWPEFHGARPHAGFRWFVVVRKKPTHSLCFSITTRPASMSSSRSREKDHCVLHSSLVDAPDPAADESVADGAIAVIVEHKGRFISPTARLDLSRVYTVEHNLKVMRLGRVHPNSLAVLEKHYKEAVR